jgi:hypothetical protein
MATAARAMTVCIVAALGFNAVGASAGGLSNDESVAGPLPKYGTRPAWHRRVLTLHDPEVNYSVP